MSFHQHSGAEGPRGRATDREDVPVVPLIVEGEAAPGDRDGAAAARGHGAARSPMPVVLPEGRLRPAWLGGVLGLAAIVGIIEVAVRSNVPFTAWQQFLEAHQVAALDVAAQAVGQATSTVGALVVVALACATAYWRAGRARAIALFALMAGAWMVYGAVQSVVLPAGGAVSGGQAVQFLATSAAFAAALAVSLAAVAPAGAPRRAVGLGVGAVAAAVGFLVAFTGVVTPLGALASLAVGSAGALLSAWAWNRWLGPIVDRQERLREALRTRAWR